MQATKFKLLTSSVLASALFVWSLTVQAESSAVMVQDNDSVALSALAQRVQPFLLSDNALTQYHAQKAQMWLTYANNERSERSLSQAAQQAKAQAVQLIEQLEQDKAHPQPQQAMATTTAIIQSSQVMRRDLWVNAELLKQNAGFDCAATEIAQAEVMLVWAAAEHCELGWRHSRELFSAAERLIDKANYQVSSCHGGTALVLPKWNKANYPSLQQLNGAGCAGVVGAWPMVVNTSGQNAPTDTTAPHSLAAQPLKALPNVVHFALDQAILSPTSQQILVDIAQQLLQNPDYALTLYGHTDARGSAAYNLALAKRRAQVVEQFLIAQGITADRIAMVAVGEKQTIANAIAIYAHALSRRVELVYASPDGQEVPTVSQTDDLQLEP